MSTHYSGIVPVGLNYGYQHPLVRSQCHYNVFDVYSIANITQEYYSATYVNIDAEYVFPLPPSASVCSFKATIDDKKVIKGVVKEKEEARVQYRQAVARGRTAGLLEQEHADGMSI
jgi:hypothetical protein